jgi:hypothetical protein
MKIATAILVCLLLPASALAEASTGNPIVYYTPNDSGVPPSSPSASLPATELIDLENGQQLFLYIDFENDPDGGISTGNDTMCVDEDGDETCGFDVWIEMTTDTATFDTFTPASSKIVGQIDTTRTSLHVNGVDVTGMAIPARIGTLTLDALGANQLALRVKGVQRVGAAGQLDPIQDVVLVPEPGVELMLIAGGAGLAGLNRLRRRTAAA